MIKKIPLPIAGLALGIAALGNLIGSYNMGARLVLGVVSAVIFITLTMKILLDIHSFKEEMKNPVIASVMATYSMAGMLLAGYIQPYAGTFSYILWYLSIIIHIGFIIYFTITFATKFNKETIVPSWFIVYVGIVVAAVNGNMFHPIVGKVAFYFGFISYIILLIPIFNRLKNNKLPEKIAPTLAIVSAPGSLCVAGYVSIFDDKNTPFLIALLVLAQLIYLFVLSTLPKLLKIKFYPSYSGLTFPLVISAIGLKFSTGYIGELGVNVSVLNVVVIIETIIAIAIVAYVLIKYCQFMFHVQKEKRVISAR
ncbi:MAG TPA: TDT family transporter [Candidatus Merdenecus merdavium]|nr:TDT family transporter [Candidatus Merdenecus merdavium]